MRVSIAVPTFEYYGRGVEVLDDMFRTISSQTLKDVEVVISDHSITDDIKNYVGAANLLNQNGQRKTKQGQKAAKALIPTTPL